MKKILVMILAFVLMLNMSIVLTASAAETGTTPDGGAKTEFSAETYGYVYGGNGSEISGGKYIIKPGDTLKFTINVTNDGTYKLTSTQTAYDRIAAYKVWINEIYMDMVEINKAGGTNTAEVDLGSYELFAGANIVELKAVAAGASIDVSKISLERTGAMTGDKITIHYTNSGHVSPLGAGFDPETQFTAVGCDFTNIVVANAGDYKVYLSSATNVEAPLKTYMQYKNGSGSWSNAATIELPDHGTVSPYDVTYLGDIKINANEAAAIRIQPLKAARFRGVMLEKIETADSDDGVEIKTTFTSNTGSVSSSTELQTGAAKWYPITIPADGNYRIITTSSCNTVAVNADVYIGTRAGDFGSKVGTIQVANTGWQLDKTNEITVELIKGDFYIGICASNNMLRLSNDLTVKQLSTATTLDCEFNAAVGDDDGRVDLGMNQGATAWYNITVPSNGSYKAVISASANDTTVAADVYIGTSTTDFSTKVGTIMVSNTGWGAGKDSETVVTLPAGTYLIGINSSNALMRLYGLTLKEAGEAQATVESETKLYLDEAVAGKAMTSLRNGNIIVNTTLNTTGTVIAALYEGGEVKDAAVCTLTNGVYQATLDASAENVTNINNSYVKVFMWDNLDDLTPLTKVFVR